MTTRQSRLAALALTAALACGCGNVSLQVVKVPPPQQPRHGDIDLTLDTARPVTVTDEGGTCGSIDEHTFDGSSGRGAAAYDPQRLAVGTALGKHFRAFSLYVPTDVNEHAATVALFIPRYRGAGQYTAGSEATALLLIGSGTDAEVTPQTATSAYVMVNGTVVIEKGLRGTFEGEFRDLDVRASTVDRKTRFRSAAVPGRGSFECALVDP